MKTIGLLGGMSWESTVEYYRIINEEVKKRLGGLNSAKCLLYSVNFAEIEYYQRTDQWERAAQVLMEAARNLKRGGADFILLCTNTMHKLADQIQGAVDIEFLHIAAATAEAIRKTNKKRIGLLGTRYTMEQDFYKAILEDYGIDVLIPTEKDRELIHEVIFTELCLGRINHDSRKEFQRINRDLIAAGAEGIILGCTELGLLVKEDDGEVPLFDTTHIHALKAVAKALE